MLAETPSPPRCDVELLYVITPVLIALLEQRLHSGHASECLLVLALGFSVEWMVQTLLRPLPSLLPFHISLYKCNIYRWVIIKVSFYSCPDRILDFKYTCNVRKTYDPASCVL